jgi:hypothetical protein
LEYVVFNFVGAWKDNGRIGRGGQWEGKEEYVGKGVEVYYTSVEQQI